MFAGRVRKWRSIWKYGGERWRKGDWERADRRPSTFVRVKGHCKINLDARGEAETVRGVQVLGINSAAAWRFREVVSKIQAGWAAWRKITGVKCDMNFKVKAKGSSCCREGTRKEDWSGRKEDSQIQQGKTRLDRVRNEAVRKTLQVRELIGKLREARFRLNEKSREWDTRHRWFRHVARW